MTGSAWIDVREQLPPMDSSVVAVKRKPESSHTGPMVWKMWACNARMALDEVGFWMPNNPLQPSKGLAGSDGSTTT